MKVALLIAVLAAAPIAVPIYADTPSDDDGDDPKRLDQILTRVLHEAGFTGRIESTLEQRLGRQIDPALADLGRLLFFDKVLGLHNDNSCAGCHSPAFGFGDSQPMAIGVDNNDIVGPNRIGPRTSGARHWLPIPSFTRLSRPAAWPVRRNSCCRHRSVATTSNSA